MIDQKDIRNIDFVYLGPDNSRYYENPYPHLDYDSRCMEAEKSDAMNKKIKITDFVYDCIKKICGVANIEGFDSETYDRFFAVIIAIFVLYLAGRYAT